jgi:predicted HTH transcriptional regulator
MSKNKGYKEEFAKFFENPDRTKFRELLKENTGEYPHIDFKEIWPDYSKLAKHVLGFSNSGGGILVIGVKEETDKSLTTIGIKALKGKTDIKSKLQNYLPSELEYEILDFKYNNDVEWENIKNQMFQVLIVEFTPEYIPFLSLKAGEELEKNRVYYRGKTNTEEATHEELKKIINRRLDTNISTTAKDEFREQIQQLETLYSFINKYPNNSVVNNTLRQIDEVRSLLGRIGLENTKYPDEDFEEFIVRMIEIKKEIIEKIISFR